MNYLQQKKRAMISGCQSYIWDYTLYPLTFQDVGFMINEYLTYPFLLTSNGYKVNSLTPTAWKGNRILLKELNKKQYDILLALDTSIGNLRYSNSLQLNFNIPIYNGKSCNLVFTNNSIYYQNTSYNQYTIFGNFGNFNSLKLTVRNNMITFYKGNDLSNFIKVGIWDSTKYQYFTSSTLSISFQATQANSNKSLLVKYLSVENIK